MKKITTKTVELLMGNNQAIGRLMFLFNKSSKTIERWIEARDVRLTTPSAFAIIKQETGLKDSEILEVVSVGIRA